MNGLKNKPEQKSDEKKKIIKGKASSLGVRVVRVDYMGRMPSSQNQRWFTWHIYDQPTL